MKEGNPEQQKAISNIKIIAESIVDKSSSPYMTEFNDNKNV